jgi:amidohydrolase
MEDFRPQTEALRQEMIARRRDLHQHPELAFEEVRTAGIVAQTLADLGMEVQTGIGKTGVIGMLEGASDGPTVMVRCDMDALPIHEENEVDYRSQTSGKMHACGHDGHTSIGLAVAKMLHAQRHRIKGRVKFIFQPAEELGKGAVAMIEDGVLHDPTPQVCFGLHLWSQIPTGEIAITAGPFMAGAAEFEIDLIGSGGHAALPNYTIDPIVAAAHLVTALQTITSRNLHPFENGVFSVTQIHAGEAFNVIPTQATLRGTFRHFTRHERDTIVKRLDEIVAGIAAAMGCQVKIRLDENVPPLVNNPEMAQTLEHDLGTIYPDLRRRNDFRTMVAEDMAFYLQQIPGVFLFVGAGDENSFPHHHPRFDLDEEALVIGASVLASAVSAYVF